MNVVRLKTFAQSCISFVLVFIWWRGKKKKEKLFLYCSESHCFFVVCALLFWYVCLWCTDGAIHHILFTVFPWVICMSLQLCFISEWLLRKLLHKTPVKMEEASNTDLKKPRAFSIFLPYMLDEELERESEREARCLPSGTCTSVGFFFFFNDSKIHAIPFLFSLSLPFLHAAVPLFSLLSHIWT